MAISQLYQPCFDILFLRILKNTKVESISLLMDLPVIYVYSSDKLEEGISEFMGEIKSVLFAVYSSNWDAG